MKFRNGFVSNSSSASFTIKKANLTLTQQVMIKDHFKTAKIVFQGEDKEHIEDLRNSDEWHVWEDEDNIYVSTTMDNFPMDEFLERIGVKEEDIQGEKDD